MPYKPNEREYRNVPITSFETRESDEGEMSLEGYALTFGEKYLLFDDVYEVIDRNALDGADMSDVIMQVNHEGSPVARLKNKSLTLNVDDHGLHVVADVSGSERGRALYEEVRNGLIDQMSFGFTISENGWEYDKKSHVSTVKSIAKVFDVSAVSIPANPGTEIKARSYLDGEIQAEIQELDKRDRERKQIAIRLNLS